MKIHDIAQSVAELVCDEEGLTQLKGRHYTAPEAKTLINCVITGLKDMTAEGFPIVVTENVKASDGLIKNTDFSHLPSTIKALERCGSRCEYRFTLDGIKVDRDGEYVVTYTVEPDYSSANDVVLFGCARDGLASCYICARNYCVVNGRYDEAEMWDGLFSRRAGSVTLRNRRIKVGRWI